MLNLFFLRNLFYLNLENVKQINVYIKNEISIYKLKLI